MLSSSSSRRALRALFLDHPTHAKLVRPQNPRATPPIVTKLSTTTTPPRPPRPSGTEYIQDGINDRRLLTCKHLRLLPCKLLPVFPVHLNVLVKDLQVVTELQVHTFRNLIRVFIQLHHHITDTIFNGHLRFPQALVKHRCTCRLLFDTSYIHYIYLGSKSWVNDHSCWSSRSSHQTTLGGTLPLLRGASFGSPQGSCYPRAVP